MPVATPTAVDQLDPSQLLSPVQMEGLGGDLDLKSFNTEMRRVGGLQLLTAITDASINRTIEGASTIVVNLDDDLERTIQRSGRLGRHTDVNIDGLWWTLVAIKKTNRGVSLTFEEREVNILRYYDSFLYASRNDITRAQFILRMIKEVKEVQLQWVIPELDIKQPILGIVPGPNQILVDGQGNPLKAGTSKAQDAIVRQKGIARGTGLTVKGGVASPEQMNNGEIILQVGQSMKASFKVLTSAMMTGITESTLHNYTGGDLDSVGVFQQRKSQGWPATRDVATDATAYFQAAIPFSANNPNISLPQLCQAVQHSAFSDGSNYAPWQAEAEQWVKQFQGFDNTSGIAAVSGSSSTAQTGQQNFFTRGTIQSTSNGGPYLLTKENSWNCMQRLAQEIRWRAFCVSGAIYFISETWLFQSKPFMVISEDSAGIDWIDYDFDEGKKNGTVTVTAHLSRWSAPPGGIVGIKNMGIIDGNWLVNDISRSIFDTVATIVLKKPDLKLPEPVNISGVPSTFGTSNPSVGGSRNGKEITVTQGNAIQQKVVAYAQSQLGVPYAYGTEIPGVSFDCSGLTQAAYNSAGLNIPHNAAAQWSFGRQLSKVELLQPGDLVFFVGGDGTVDAPGHVGIYIGNGNMIDAPHTGAVVRVEGLWSDYVGATRPWQS